MGQKDFTITFLTGKSPEHVYNAINKVPEWWCEVFEGDSAKLNKEFSVTFNDLHYSKHKLVELVPNKTIVWLVTDSNLSFLKNKTEWNGTKNRFDISTENGKTIVLFTHEGLTPEIECFNACSGGWNRFINQSLVPFIESGNANPHKKGAEL
ncbi:MAG TPA: SRPBCC domain-containing protein [Flavobacteriales bacterium]|nr:SRPBCC domain-containing protein [Flavobacteriales bacterium]